MPVLQLWLYCDRGCIGIWAVLQLCLYCDLWLYWNLGCIAIWAVLVMVAVFGIGMVAVFDMVSVLT